MAGLVNAIPVIESHFGINHEAFEVAGAIRVAPINKFKALNISTSVLWNQKRWDLSGFSLLRRVDADNPEDTSDRGITIVDANTIVLKRTLVTYDSDYLRESGTREYIATTTVKKNDDGSIEVFTEYGYKSFMFAQRINDNTFNDQQDLDRIVDLYGDMFQPAIALGTNYLLFNPTDVATDPVYTSEVSISYQNSIATITPSIQKDGVEVQNPNVRWEWKLDTPAGITARIGDTTTDRELKLTTDSRNRGCVFLPSPKGFRVTGYYQGEDGKGFPINVKLEFEGDLILPEFEIPFVISK